jgi:TusA-related sulfurtransferase
MIVICSPHEEHQLTYLKLDIRKTSCQGGGAIWTLLSHVRDLPPGDKIEIFTDDYMASADIPAWIEKRHWKVTHRQQDGYVKFTIQRPRELAAAAS